MKIDPKHDYKKPLYERTIIEVADRLGNELYEYNAKEFADFFAVKA